jgi:hypothetical protein
MIGKKRNRFTLSCDVCHEEVEEFYDFHEAVMHKKLNNWKSQKRNGEWEDVCPDCQN